MNHNSSNLIIKTRSVIYAGFLWIFYGALSRLWFIRHIEKPQVTGSCLYAHFHGDELLLMGSYAWKKMAVMVSRSRDGEMLGLFLKWFGYKVVRGSSSKGGAGGLKGLIDLVYSDKYDASLAVDGPRGPIHKVKPGIIKLAQTTGKPLIPGAASTNSAFVFKKAWNKCFLPLPFSRGVIVYGKPIYVPKECSEDELEQYRFGLENELMRLKQTAENLANFSLKTNRVLGT